jgi:hypothetical protein
MFTDSRDKSPRSLCGIPKHSPEHTVGFVLYRRMTKESNRQYNSGSNSLIKLSRFSDTMNLTWQTDNCVSTRPLPNLL